MSRRTGRLRRAIGVAASAAAAAGAARAAHAALSRRPPGGRQTWTRTNHRGEPVTLLEGPALAASAAVAAALDPGLPARTRAALVAAAAGAAAFGGYDDLAGSGKRRGFRGHLGALAHGEVTTGAVKLGGIGATGLVASALLGGSAADVAINAGLAAGSANLINLFDLRPGRAIKVGALGGALLATRPGGARAAAAPLGAAAALLPDDLGERAMLGDAGANALGAMLGVAAGSTLSRPARIALLAVITGLTAASEKVSFTAVIARTPALHKLDMAGRRPPAPAQAPPAPGSGPDDDTGPLPAQPGPDTSPGAVVTEPGSAQAGPAEEAASGTRPAAP
jgi:UDP-GlcNAc:undecaprenyl-phosphate/decaprenyl-phosphate GlcNAc-1-phosphate transferase